MENKELFIVSTRYKGENTYLFVDDNMNFGIRNSKIKFITRSISPFQFAAYIYSSLAEQIDKKFIFSDSNVEFYKNNELQGKGTLRIYKGQNSPMREKFPLKIASAKIEANFINQDSEHFLSFKLTTIKSLEFIGLLLTKSKPISFYFLSEIKIIKKDNGISIKIGGGSPALLSPEDIDVFLFALERWLVGKCIYDEIAIEKYNNLPEVQRPENRPYRTTRVNRKGLFFSAQINFKEFKNKNNVILSTRLNVNGLITQLTFMEIAELYFVLKNMNASYIDEKF